MGIYDSTILVLAGLLLTAEFCRKGVRPSALPLAYKFLLLILYVTPLFTQPIARALGVQIYTLAVAVFGIYQLWTMNDLTRDSERTVAQYQSV
jgi:hypothetical protein